MYPQVFGKYVLERELSRGGMARVLLATLRGAGGFEKKLVVKQIRDDLSYDQQFVRRFVEEAKTTVALSHPNIVPVYELGVEQGTYFLAMELVEGLSIAELLRERDDEGRKRVLSPEEGAYVGMEVCRALDYAHRRMKVVHRDITPRNVMLDEEGQVKLIDFGIAAPARVAGHEILGSPGHMPPEQVDGGELGPATDIFAVAVLLMEAWTGVAPFRRATPEECDAAMREPHPRPSDFNPALLPLDEVIGRAMNLDPNQRPNDATELARRLRLFLQGFDTSDIARALGDRVRDARVADSSPSPDARETGQHRAAFASQGDLGTKTFAARDEALHWSDPPPNGGAKDPSVPPDAPSTRQLGEALIVSAGDVVMSVPKPRPSRPRPIDPAMSIPTPLMIDRDELEKLETIATRPLETPVHRRSSVPPPAARAPRSTWIYAALAGVVVAGGLVAWRVTDTSPKPKTEATPTASGTAVAPPATTIAPAKSGTTPTASTGATAAPPTTTATTTAAPPASSVAVAGQAQVILVGEPGTRVAVDGVSKGTCPARVVVSAGSHNVQFTFDPTGESRGQNIDVHASERVTVRAKFTGATPLIEIQH